MNNRPTGTVTFLFTDIEGSTKLWEHHPNAMKSALARHDALTRDAIEKHRGHVFKTVGDAFCAAFATASDALVSACAAQRALYAENWGSIGALRVRMALHTGVTEERGDDYVGPILNRVARLLSAGHGGQTLLSLVTAELVRDHLPEGVTLRDLGEGRLKDLDRPEHIFQLVTPDLPSEFPPLKTLDTLPNNLPIQLTSFIGREREIEAVRRLLSTTRLLTLTGSGGVGKTRLALQAAVDMLEAFADGVWLVELAPLSNPALVSHSVATVFSVREDKGRPLMNALQEYLRTKNLLLILDNCEHLLDACAQLVDTLLRTCPGLKIIASSREALGVAGETPFRVPSLSLPDPRQLPTIENLTQFDAVQLFIERAIAVKPDFQVTNANAPAVAQVCHRLDGIPLAIELAAARVKGLAVEQIAARLDDRFRLLTGGSRTALPRQQTLRTSIDWSYDLLSEKERVLLRRLSVFVGDWTLEAGEVVCIDNDSEASEVLDLLLRLVDKSLVVVEEQEGEARYRLLETIRQYARDKLLESGEAEQVRARHLEFFLTFAEKARPALRGIEQLKLLNRQRSEYENLRTAIVWALGDSDIKDTLRSNGKTESGLRLVYALEQLGDVQLLLGVGTQSIPLYQEAIDLWRGLVGADKMIALRLHGKIIQTVTDLKWHVEIERFNAASQVAAASRASLEAGLELAEGEPPHLETVRVLRILSINASQARIPPDWDAAERHARAAVDMAEQLDAPLELSASLGALANVYLGRELWRERVKVALRRQALSRDPRFGDILERINTLNDAAEALIFVGEYTQALSYAVQAESLASRVEAANQEKIALGHQIHCCFRLDRWDEMFKLGEKRRDLQRRYSRERIGPSCFQLAQSASVHARRGEFDIAATEREEAYAIMVAADGPPERWERNQHL